VQTRASLACLADELDRLAKQTTAAEAKPKKPRAKSTPTLGLNGEGPGLAAPKRRGRKPKHILEAVANE
jgi:hypothetical protein